MIYLDKIEENIGATEWKDKIDEYAEYLQLIVLIWNGKYHMREGHRTYRKEDHRMWYLNTIYKVTPENARLTKEEQKKAMSRQVTEGRKRLAKIIKKSITKEQVDNWEYIKDSKLNYPKTSHASSK